MPGPILFYGVVLTAISVGFFIRDVAEGSLDSGMWRQVMKFLFSLSAAWLLVLLLVMAVSTDFQRVDPGSIAAHWLLAVLIAAPVVFHVGLQMLLYGLYEPEQ